MEDERRAGSRMWNVEIRRMQLEISERRGLNWSNQLSCASRTSVKVWAIVKVGSRSLVAVNRGSASSVRCLSVYDVVPGI